MWFCALLYLTILLQNIDAKHPPQVFRGDEPAPAKDMIIDPEEVDRFVTVSYMQLYPNRNKSTLTIESRVCMRSWALYRSGTWLPCVLTLCIFVYKISGWNKHNHTTTLIIATQIQLLTLHVYTTPVSVCIHSILIAHHFYMLVDIKTYLL